MLLALMIGRGGRAPTTARSSLTWSVVRWWTCWRIVRRRPRPVGSRITRTWRWSAATVLASMRRLRVRARRRRGRSPIAFICCRTPARPSSDSSAALRRRSRILRSTPEIIRRHHRFQHDRSASDAVTQKRLMRRRRQAVRQQLFDEIRALFEGGSSVREIARKLGLGRRRVERWVRRIDLPDLNTMASNPCTPAYFGTLLARRWAEGITKVRHLFTEIRHRGYTGSYSHLARFLAPWRSCEPSFDGDEQVRADQEEPAPVRVRTLDPMWSCDLAPDRGGA